MGDDKLDKDSSGALTKACFEGLFLFTYKLNL